MYRSSPEHVAFLERLRLYHETATHIFVHANYAPNEPSPSNRPTRYCGYGWTSPLAPISQRKLSSSATRGRRMARFWMWAISSASTRDVASGDCLLPWMSIAERSGRWQKTASELTLSSERMRRFERCPRCSKTWAMFAVYRCPSCGLSFCAGCNLDDPGSQDLRWLTAAAAEARVTCCPACTVVITDSDKIGVIVGREKRSKS